MNIKKLLSEKGESLIEILAAIMIVALCMAMLATAVAASFKVNKSTRNANTGFKYDAANDDSITTSVVAVADPTSTDADTEIWDAGSGKTGVFVRFGELSEDSENRIVYYETAD